MFKQENHTVGAIKKKEALANQPSTKLANHPTDRPTTQTNGSSQVEFVWWASLVGTMAWLRATRHSLWWAWILDIMTFCKFFKLFMLDPGSSILSSNSNPARSLCLKKNLWSICMCSAQAFGNGLLWFLQYLQVFYAWKTLLAHRCSAQALGVRISLKQSASPSPSTPWRSRSTTGGEQK